MTKAKLALMMFLEFFIWGAWYVTVTTWVSQTLHFNGVQTGLISGTTAIGAVLSPFLAGWIADNLMAAQWMLSLLHFVGAVMLYIASTQSHFGPLYGFILAYAVVYMPTLGLANAIAFRQIRDPKTEFAPIRVLGTLGWICAGADRQPLSRGCDIVSAASRCRSIVANGGLRFDAAQHPSPGGRTVLCG